MTVDLKDLEFDYDDEGDVLLIAVRGFEGRPAVTYETDEGHLVRLDPETHEFLGAEVLGFRATWEGRDIILEWDVSERVGLLRRPHTRHERTMVPRMSTSAGSRA
jgi:hypothetical protein